MGNGILYGVLTYKGEKRDSIRLFSSHSYNTAFPLQSQ